MHIKDQRRIALSKILISIFTGIRARDLLISGVLSVRTKPTNIGRREKFEDMSKCVFEPRFFPTLLPARYLPILPFLSSCRCQSKWLAR